MKKYKVFISGPMSGYPENNKPMFDKCQKALEERGFAVFNPSWLSVDDTAWSRGELMAIDITALSHCDAICFLPGAEKSSGSNLERDFAKRIGLPALLFTDDGNVVLSSLTPNSAIPIECLNLSVRAYNTLKRSGINYVFELIELSKDELAKLRNLSKKQYSEIMESLGIYNIILNG